MSGGSHPWVPYTSSGGAPRNLECRVPPPIHSRARRVTDCNSLLPWDIGGTEAVAARDRCHADQGWQPTSDQPYTLEERTQEPQEAAKCSSWGGGIHSRLNLRHAMAARSARHGFDGCPTTRLQGKHHGRDSKRPDGLPAYSRRSRELFPIDVPPPEGWERARSGRHSPGHILGEGATRLHPHMGARKGRVTPPQ